MKNYFYSTDTQKRKHSIRIRTLPPCVYPTPRKDLVPWIPYPPVNRLTYTCENITFPQFRWCLVKILHTMIRTQFLFDIFSNDPIHSHCFLTMELYNTEKITFMLFLEKKHVLLCNTNFCMQFRKIIGFYEESVSETKKISHCAVKFKASKENSAVDENWY